MIEEYLAEMNELYPIGSYVSIIDIGKIYPTFGPMFTKLGFRDSGLNRYDLDWSTDRWRIFTPVVQHSNYINAPHPLVGIESNGNQLLIHLDGVDRISNNNAPTELVNELYHSFGLSPYQQEKIIALFRKYYDLK